MTSYARCRRSKECTGATIRSGPREADRTRGNCNVAPETFVRAAGVDQAGRLHAPGDRHRARRHAARRRPPVGSLRPASAPGLPASRAPGPGTIPLSCFSCYPALYLNAIAKLSLCVVNYTIGGCVGDSRQLAATDGTSGRRESGEDTSIGARPGPSGRLHCVRSTPKNGVRRGGRGFGNALRDAVTLRFRSVRPTREPAVRDESSHAPPPDWTQRPERRGPDRPIGTVR